MSASSPRSPSTPRSSSRPDVSAAVQELLDLRREKEKYKELQALLVQGLEGLRRQQDEVEQAEILFRTAFQNIINISDDVDDLFKAMLNDYDLMLRRIHKPYMLKIENLRDNPELYFDRTYGKILALGIQHHEKALMVLKETLSRFKVVEIDDDKTDISGHKEAGQAP